LVLAYGRASARLRKCAASSARRSRSGNMRWQWSRVASAPLFLGVGPRIGQPLARHAQIGLELQGALEVLLRLDPVASGCPPAERQLTPGRVGRRQQRVWLGRSDRISRAATWSAYRVRQAPDSRRASVCLPFCLGHRKYSRPTPDDLLPALRHAQHAGVGRRSCRRTRCPARPSMKTRSFSVGAQIQVAAPFVEGEDLCRPGCWPPPR